MSDRMFALIYVVILLYATPIVLGGLGAALYFGFPWTLVLLPLAAPAPYVLYRAWRAVLGTFWHDDILWDG